MSCWRHTPPGVNICTQFWWNFTEYILIMQFLDQLDLSISLGINLGGSYIFSCPQPLHDILAAFVRYNQAHGLKCFHQGSYRILKFHIWQNFLLPDLQLKNYKNFRPDFFIVGHHFSPDRSLLAYCVETVPLLSIKATKSRNNPDCDQR